MTFIYRDMWVYGKVTAEGGFSGMLRGRTEEGVPYSVMSSLTLGVCVSVFNGLNRCHYRV